MAAPTHRFRYGDETFDCDLAPLGPEPAEAATPIDCIVRRRTRRPGLRGVEWLSRSDDWPPGYRVGRRDDDLEIWLGGQAVLSISADGLRVRYWAAVHLDDGYLSHLLLDHALPARLGVLGRRVFHGTAVDVGGSAVAFLGVTGVGKSTMAAGFAAAGHPLLADDCLLLDDRRTPDVVPTYPGMRLTADTLRVVLDQSAPRLSRLYPKHFVGTGADAVAFGTEPVPLGALVFLAPGAPATRLERLRPIDALERLLAQTWYFDGAGAELFAVVDRVGAVVDAVPVLELEVRDDLRSLGECRRLISEQFASSS